MSGPMTGVTSAPSTLFASAPTPAYDALVASDNAFASALNTATSQLAAASGAITAPSAPIEGTAPSSSPGVGGLLVGYEGPLPSLNAASDLYSLPAASGATSRVPTVIPAPYGSPVSLSNATTLASSSGSTPGMAPAGALSSVASTSASVSSRGSAAVPATGARSARVMTSAATSGPSGAGAGVVTTAQQFLGTPYVWGGTTPAGFDCSGLVQYVYARNGVQLPRTSEEQATAGQPVASLAQARPGDLLFFAGSDGTASSPGHVAIYAGGDQMIDAPYSGTTVRVESVSDAGPVVAIRRVLPS